MCLTVLNVVEYPWLKVSFIPLGDKYMSYIEGGYLENNRFIHPQEMVSRNY